ncbi:MAG: hypothetical protein Q8L27_00355 [archaeon]|nr:hypothetical protein [archaeon]
MVDKEIITNYPRERLIAMMHEATFPKQDSEAIYVGGVIFSYRRTTDILPDILNPKHNDKELANRGLLAVGFFREKLIHRYKDHGGPSIEYFMGITRKRLMEIGQTNVGENTENWADYLHNNFQIKQEPVEKGIVPVHGYETSRFHKTFPNSLNWKGLGPLENTPLEEDPRKNIEFN